MATTRQLRMYTIEPGRLDDFAAEWAASVRPLRVAKGFRVEGAWTVPTDDVFVWIVAWDGPDDWQTANDAYYASPERAAIQPDPARLIREQRLLLLTPVEGT